MSEFLKKKELNKYAQMDIVLTVFDSVGSFCLFVCSTGGGDGATRERVPLEKSEDMSPTTYQKQAKMEKRI